MNDPNLTVYPVRTHSPGPAVIYCAGGAYKVLGLPGDKDIKKWNELGITVFLLKYTIPDQVEKAFEDIQRAVGMVRNQAETWNIDPHNIGVMGNSSGGHLAARLSQNYTQKIYDPFDGMDKESCRPNFVVLQCAAYFHGCPFGKELDTKLFYFKHKIAPTFLTYSKDDKFYAGGVEYSEKLIEMGISSHLKTFEKGGRGMSGCDWFSEMAAWLKKQKIVR